MSQSLWEQESSSLVVLNMIDLVIETIQGMYFLNLESGLVSLLLPIFFSHAIGLNQTFESILIERLFHLNLAKIEEVLVSLFELLALSKSLHI